MYDANTLEEMGGSVVESEGKPAMALSDDGLTFAVCDGKETTRLRVWRLGISNEYLEKTCKQCEEPGVNEAFDDYCKDSFSLNPLGKISPLYKTSKDDGGDDTCWNTDISKRVKTHPTTRKKFTVKKLVLPPPSILRLHREATVDIAFSDIEKVVVNGKGHGESTVDLKLKNGLERRV